MISFTIYEPFKTIPESHLHENSKFLYLHQMKTIDVMFDSENSFYYNLRDLRGIHKSLHVKTEILVASAMISNRLDYCNLLLNGVSKGSVAKFQNIQPILCHIVYKLDKMNHVTTNTEKFHWLSISYHILFNFSLFSRPSFFPNLTICHI